MNEFWQQFEARYTALKAIRDDLAIEVRAAEQIPDADDEYRYRMHTALLSLNAAVGNFDQVAERRKETECNQ